jgi:hypothetical protein
MTAAHAVAQVGNCAVVMIYSARYCAAADGASHHPYQGKGHDKRTFPSCQSWL